MKVLNPKQVEKNPEFGISGRTSDNSIVHWNVTERNVDSNEEV